MTLKFTSKEIHFLKSDSDNFDIKAPEKYFSDLLLDKTIELNAFEKRLSQTKIPGENFLTAVIEISSEASELVQDKAKDTFEATFSSLLDHERGLWETLNETSFIFAFWDYSSEKKAFQLIESLKASISTSLGTHILVGVAPFPFHEFSKTQIPENALKAIDHAAFFGSDALIHFDTTSINICADRLYQLNKCDMAIKEYNSGLTIDPTNINLLNSLGVCYGIMGDLDQARIQFDKAMKIKSNDPMVNYNIGLLYQIEENLDKAIIYLRKAHGIDDNIFEIELLLGHLLFKQKHYKTALEHLENAGIANLKSGMSFRIKGEIYLVLNEPVKAGSEFNKAIKLNPSDAISLSGYAKSLEVQDKNLTIALTFAKNSISLEPDNKLFKNRLRVIQEKIDLTPEPEVTIKSA